MNHFLKPVKPAKNRPNFFKKANQIPGIHSNNKVANRVLSSIWEPNTTYPLRG